MDCCKLVGNYNIDLSGIISISSSGSTNVSLVGTSTHKELIIGAATGTVNITAYADTVKYFGCKASANVSINWIIKNDCDNVVFLYGGAGNSTIVGENVPLVKFPNLGNGITNPINKFVSINASASSSPSTLYSLTHQYTGYGLIYDGYPWYIDTTNEKNCRINLTSYGIGEFGECMLQSLSVDFSPNQIPTVSMSFIYDLNNN